MKYDDLNYHDGGFSDPGCSRDQAGFLLSSYFSWMVSARLINEEIYRDGELFEVVSDRALSLSEIFSRYADDKLVSLQFSPEGNSFTEKYYQSDAYFSDAETALPGSGLYQVEPNWSNYDVLAKLLDRKLTEWRNAEGPGGAGATSSD